MGIRATFKKVRMIGSAVVFMAVAMGFVNLRANDSFIRYHNDFALKAYQEVIIDGWNKFIDKAHEDSSTDESVAAFLKSSVIPNADKWSAKAGEVKPPELVAPFHAMMSADLTALTTELKELADDLEHHKGNTKELMARSNTTVQKTQGDLVDLQKLLTKERGIDFQVPGKS